MTKEEIAILVVILIMFLFFIIMIFIKSINRNINYIKSNRQYLPEQKDFVKLIEINKLEIPQRYYSYTYTHSLIFKSIDDSRVIELCVEEYETKILEIGEEYNITHDGVVLFSYYKSLLG